jgi:hypothetical protein
MQRIKIVAITGTEPLSLASLKSRLKITSNADDDYLNEIIVQAREMAENLTRRSIILQTLRASIDFEGCPPTGSDPWWDGIRQGSILMFTPAYLTLLAPPAVSVESIKTYDLNDTMSVYSAANYRLDNSDPMQYARVVLNYGAIWPSAMRYLNSIEIDFTAGWANGTVPKAIVGAIAAMAAYMYANRAACDAACCEKCGALAMLRPYFMMEPAP